MPLWVWLLLTILILLCLLLFLLVHVKPRRRLANKEKHAITASRPKSAVDMSLAPMHPLTSTAEESEPLVSSTAEECMEEAVAELHEQVARSVYVAPPIYVLPPVYVRPAASLCTVPGTSVTAPAATIVSPAV